MSDFVDELPARIDAGRSFGRHPFWLAMLEGELSIEALYLFAAQNFLQVREFPRAVSALHARCPDAEQRAHLAESLWEEETGRVTGCGLPHPELFIRFGEGLGLPREALVDAEPLPETQQLIDWFAERAPALNPEP